MPSLSSQIYLLVVIKLLFLFVIYVIKFEMTIISKARIKGASMAMDGRIRDVFFLVSF